jgi:hypothetical protein
MLLLIARGSSQSGYFFLVWIAIVLLIFLTAYLFEQKRKRDIAAAAANLGFMPNEELPISCELPLLQRSSEIENIFTGSSVGLEAAFFDVQVGQGRGSYTQTVAGFRRPGLVIPPFEFHETNFGDRIAGFFPSKIVRVDSDLNFSSRYTLRSVNPEEVKIFFTPEIAAHFVQLPPHGWTIEGSDDSVIVYRSRKRVSPSNLSNFLNETGNVAAGFLGLLRPTSVF